MTSWDGSGLPPTARARIDRAQQRRTRTSLLSVPAASTLQAVGFDAVGEVMGCVVQQIGWAGIGGCGQWSPGGFYYSSTTIAASTSRGGLHPYVRAVSEAYDLALQRMTLEARGLGADGVVGVRTELRLLEQQTTEYVVLGTAVRARSRTHPAEPFTTDLPGTDVAKLLAAGWAPVRYLVAVDVGVRHIDWATQRQAGPWLNSANTEVDGFTELAHLARGFARDRLERQARAAGATGTLMSSLGMEVRHVECGAPGGGDAIAEVRMTGTAITALHRFRVPRAPSQLSILPLRPPGVSARQGTKGRR